MAVAIVAMAVAKVVLITTAGPASTAVGAGKAAFVEQNSATGSMAAFVNFVVPTSRPDPTADYASYFVSVVAVVAAAVGSFGPDACASADTTDSACPCRVYEACSGSLGIF